MKRNITVVGAANVDITATVTGKYIPFESNPASVTIAFGGVGRNIAHHLCRRGHSVRFVTMWGDDSISQTIIDNCRQTGMSLDPLLRVAGMRSNYFICVNDGHGLMQAGAADMELIDALTPEILAPAMDSLNNGAAIVADCNVSEAVLRFLASRARVPLYVDATSAAKAVKINAVLDEPHACPVIVKVNRAEAGVLVGSAESLQDMALRLVRRGAARVYMTMGAQGACCHNGDSFTELPAPAVDVVNATGAGDAFMAAVVDAELQTGSIGRALRCGIEAAAAALQTIGAT